MFGLRNDRNNKKSRIGLGLEHLERRELFSVDGLSEPLQGADLSDEISPEIAEFSPPLRAESVQSGASDVAGRQFLAAITDHPVGNAQPEPTTFFAVVNQSDSDYKVRWGVAWYDNTGATTFFALANASDTPVNPAINQLWGDYFFVETQAESSKGSFDSGTEIMIWTARTSSGEETNQSGGFPWSPDGPTLSQIFTDGFESGDVVAWSVQVAAQGTTPHFSTNELPNNPIPSQIFTDGFESGDLSAWSVR